MTAMTMKKAGQSHASGKGSLRDSAPAAAKETNYYDVGSYDLTATTMAIK